MGNNNFIKISNKILKDFNKNLLRLPELIVYNEDIFYFVKIKTSNNLGEYRKNWIDFLDNKEGLKVVLFDIKTKGLKSRDERVKEDPNIEDDEPKKFKNKIKELNINNIEEYQKAKMLYLEKRYIEALLYLRRFFYTLTKFLYDTHNEKSENNFSEVKNLSSKFEIVKNYISVFSQKEKEQIPNILSKSLIYISEEESREDYSKLKDAIDLIIEDLAKQKKEKTKTTNYENKIDNILSELD